MFLCCAAVGCETPHVFWLEWRVRKEREGKKRNTRGGEGRKMNMDIVALAGSDGVDAKGNVETFLKVKRCTTHNTNYRMFKASNKSPNSRRRKTRISRKKFTAPNEKNKDTAAQPNLPKTH